MKVLIALILPSVLGYLIVSLADGRGGRGGLGEKLAIGFGAGYGIVVYEIFLMGLAGIPLTLTFITAIIILSIFLLIVIRLRLPFGAGASARIEGVTHQRDPFKIFFASALILWITLKVLFVLYGGLYFPILSQDTWWNWSGTAKFFFYSKSLVLDPSNEHFFGTGYRPFLGYPLLNPLMQLWTALIIGDFHEALVKACMPVYYISCLAVVFFAVKKEGGFYAGLLTAFFLSAAPLMTYHAVDAYSDLPLAFYVLSGSVFLWRYMEEGGESRAALSGLLFAMGAFTKNEGVVYLAAGFMAITAFNLLEKRREWKSILYFSVPALLYIGPWLLFKAYYGIGYGHGSGVGVGAEDVAGGLVLSGALHPGVIPVFFKEIFLTINHGLVFPFLALIAVLGVRTLMRSNIKYLILIIILAAAVFLADYIVTDDFIFVFNRTGMNRNALTFLPLSFLAAGLLTSRLLKGLSKKEV
ncbi:MAG: hypothetical protein ACE5EB_07440 [Thermodesulfobacteriota bacterium]